MFVNYCLIKETKKLPLLIFTYFLTQCWYHDMTHFLYPHPCVLFRFAEFIHYHLTANKYSSVTVIVHWMAITNRKIMIKRRFSSIQHLNTALWFIIYIITLILRCSSSWLNLRKILVSDVTITLSWIILVQKISPHKC